MRIYNFNIPVIWVKVFVGLGTIASSLFCFAAALVDFKLYVYWLWSLIELVVTGGAFWLFFKTFTRKKLGKLRFLHDLCLVCLNFILLYNYARFAIGGMYHYSDFVYTVEIAALIIIASILLGLAYLISHRELMKKVWS